MQVRAFAASDTGKVRKHNEDSYTVDDDLGLYVVCDGMGGHAAGDIASRTAINVVTRVLGEHRDKVKGFDGSQPSLLAVSAVLEHALCEASRTVHEAAASDRGKHGMGTTCVALLVLGDKAVMANVGDSRLYLARAGKLHQLSTDHNFMNEMLAHGMTTPEQAANVAHGSMLTRAIGVQPTVRVDLLTFDVLPGDTLLLCSDGLYDYARDPSQLADQLAAEKLEQIAPQLVAQALAGGGHDNATALVVRVLSEDERQHARKSSVMRHLDALKEIDLFREFNHAELVQLYNACTQCELAPGEHALREGDRGDYLFVIIEGSFEVSRQGQHIATVGPGAHVGEMALLNQRPRSATVTALERARLLRLERGDFRALMAREPCIAAKFLWQFAHTLSLRLDDGYLARDFRMGRTTLGLGEYPSPFE